jgi:hypothetical protein
VDTQNQFHLFVLLSFEGQPHPRFLLGWMTGDKERDEEPWINQREVAESLREPAQRGPHGAVDLGINGMAHANAPKVAGYTLQQRAPLRRIQRRGRRHHEFELVVGESERHGHAASSGLSLASSNSARSPGSRCLVRTRYSSSLSSTTRQKPKL